MKVRMFVVLVVVALCAIVAGGFGGYFYAVTHRAAAGAAAGAAPAAEPPADDDDDASPPSVASVVTAPAREGQIAQTITVYGQIVPRADAQQAVVAPLDVRVSKLLVTQGQDVEADTPVALVAPSPDMHLAYVQAQSTLSSVRQALQNTQQRYNMQLATTADLQAAKTAVTDANLKIEDLIERGADRPQTLTAPKAGIIGKIDVQLGQIVPAGTPLVWVDDPTRVDARLGLVPEDAALVSLGQMVEMASVNNSGRKAPAKISVVSHQVNPDTHLVDVRAALPTDQHWLLGEPLEAHITTAQHEALIVPRQAVLPQEGRQTLFTVQDGKAVMHEVTLGLQNDTVVELAKATPPVKSGDTVVIQGNYELTAGMAVKVVTAP